MTEKSWNEQLKDWIKENPDRIKQLTRKLKRRTIYHITSGEAKKLDGINPVTRALIFDVTGLEVFHFPSYSSPDNINVDKIISGENRDQLDLWLGYMGTNRENFSKEIGVHPQTLSNYFRKKSLSKKSEKKISRAIKEYSAKDQKEMKKEVPQQVSALTRPDAQDQLPALVQQATSAIKSLNTYLGEQPITTEQRHRMVGKTIESLANLMEYYNGASQSERNQLVSYLKNHELIPIYGYAVNLLSGMARGDNDPDSFARAFSIPKQNKK
jgi:hypothetical protein